MKLTYHQCGDYLLPDLGLDERDHQTFGKYGRMRMDYLEQHRPILYNRLLLSGELIPHLAEIDKTCNKRLNHMMPLMMQQEGVTEELKARDPMEWVARMNSIHNRIEEMLQAELIFD